MQNVFFSAIVLHYLLKGAEAASVEIAEIKKCFRLKGMLNFNVF